MQWATLTNEDRLRILLEKTVRTERGCLEYTGCIQSNGYSRATIRRQSDYGHRHAFRLAHGEIPDGLDVCHKCDNRRCINPDHLFLGTRLENMQDAVSKGRQARGLNLPQAKLSPEHVDQIVSLAKQGLPYREIAERFGIHRVGAGAIAIKHGIRRNQSSNGAPTWQTT